MSHPEPFARWESRLVVDLEASGGQLITLIYNVSASAGYSAQELIDKGSTVCALVDYLERLGKRVEIQFVDTSGSISSSHLNNAFYLNVQLKRFQDPLDLERVVYALAHPSAMRRLCFAVEEQQTNEVVQIFGFMHSYGRAIEYSPVPKNCIYVGCNDLRHQSRTEMKNWIVGQLEKYGIAVQNAT